MIETRHIIAFCAMCGFIFLVFAVYGFIEEMQDKQEKLQRRRAARHKNDLEKSAYTADVQQLYNQIRFKAEKYYNASICKQCIYGTPKKCCLSYTPAEIFTDDLGVICDCNKYIKACEKR